MEILLSFVGLFLSLIFIVFACVLFTNAIEHLGEKLHLSEGAVGSVLAAVGTALPETIVPLVAILGAYIAGTNFEQGNEVAIGAILGAPFMLGTLAFFVTGLAVIIYSKTKRRTMDMPVNTTLMLRDLHYFAISYFIAIISSCIPFSAIRHFIALLLISIYGVYVYLTVKTPSCSHQDNEDELESLYLSRFFKNSDGFIMALIVLQLIFSLLLIVFLAHLFVEDLKNVSTILKINPLILSMIITPIATELPEKFNSVIWIRAKKDTLALGNITGAMVFQSCIPTAVGLALTPWVLTTDSIVNVIVVYLSVLVVYINIVRNKGVIHPGSLLSGGFFYLLFIAYVAYKILAV